VWDKSSNSVFPEDEEESVCMEKTVYIELTGVDELDRSVTVDDSGNLKLTISDSGWQ
jgi:hypothetical protein